MTTETERFQLIDPVVAEQVKSIAAERVNPFVKGSPRKRSERTQALLDGATVFIPGDMPTRNWSGWYRRVLRPHGLRVRQLYAEFEGRRGHFVWAQPIEKGQAK